MAPKLLERQLLRTRNGLAHLAGVRAPDVAQTPKDLVWQRETARLWRYRSEDRSVKVPLLIVHSLISKSYILDLLPENSMVALPRRRGVRRLPARLGPGRARRRGEHARDLRRRPDPGRDRRAPRADEVTLLGYCYGGVLALLTAASQDLPIRNLVTLTTPCDFQRIGFMSDMFLAGRLDADDVIDEHGLVPPRVLDAGFQSIKPTDQLVQPLNLWEQLWSADRTENFLALNGWTRDQIPFPGALLRQTVDAADPREPPAHRRAAARRRRRPG